MKYSYAHWKLKIEGRWKSA